MSGTSNEIFYSSELRHTGLEHYVVTEFAIADRVQKKLGTADIILSH